MDEPVSRQADHPHPQLANDRDDVRVMVVDGNEFRRDSSATLLGFQPRIMVTAVALGTAEALNYLKHDPVDVLVVDMDVPPKGAVDLVKLARSAHQGIGSVVLAETATLEFAAELFDQDVAGIGILERVDIRHATEVVSAIEAVARKGTVISPRLVILLARRVGSEPKFRLSNLTPREHEILAGVARGLSNRAIADELGLRARTVESAVGNILQKLGERGHPDHDGRVRATLFYLKATGRATFGA